MKTQVKLFIAIGLIAALCVGFLIGISIDYPKPDETELAGTFGKVEKFRKVQMTAKDIKLRSELVKDTVELRKLIHGLAYFSLFAEDLRTNIQMAIISFKAKGMETLPGKDDKVNALQDYSDFIWNNNKTLNTTVAMLTGFYMNDTVDTSQDVEKNLKDFGTYVNKLNEKNEVLNQALQSMDNFMLDNKTLHARKADIARLKSIRDQLLVKCIQLGGILHNKEQVGRLIKYSLSSQKELNQFMGKPQSDNYAASAVGQLDMILDAQGGIGVNINLDAAGNIGNQDMILVYDNINGQFIIGNADQLNYNSNVPLQSGLDVITWGNAGNLEIQLENYSLEQILQSEFGAAYPGAVQDLNVIGLESQVIGAVFDAAIDLNSALDVIDTNIGAIGQ